MKFKRTFLTAVLAVLVAVGVGYSGFQFGLYHYVGDGRYYNNDPNSDYGAAIAESPTVLIDASAGSIAVGPGDSTEPTVILSVINSAPAFKGMLQLSAVQAFGATDTTPDVSGFSYFTTDASTQTITDFDGSGLVDGQLLYIVPVNSLAAPFYLDCTSSGIKCGTTDILAVDGDSIILFYDGADWLLVNFMDNSDDQS